MGNRQFRLLELVKLIFISSLVEDLEQRVEQGFKYYNECYFM